jgi:hypothetical protein
MQALPLGSSDALRDLSLPGPLDFGDPSPAWKRIVYIPWTLESLGHSDEGQSCHLLSMCQSIDSV